MTKTIFWSKKFKQDYKRLINSVNLETIDKLLTVFEMLANRQNFPEKYKDHLSHFDKLSANALNYNTSTTTAETARLNHPLLILNLVLSLHHHKHCRLERVCVPAWQ